LGWALRVDVSGFRLVLVPCIRKLGDADGQTDSQASRLKMTVTGNARQVQLAVEAVLLVGRQSVCSWNLSSGD
jgi:hypothetical protein